MSTFLHADWSMGGNEQAAEFARDMDRLVTTLAEFRAGSVPRWRLEQALESARASYLYGGVSKEQGAAALPLIREVKALLGVS